MTELKSGIKKAERGKKVEDSQQDENVDGELTAGHCVPCEGCADPLDLTRVQDLAKLVPEWKVDGAEKIRREFLFPNFSEAFGFVARVALLAETEGHHPDFEFGWGRVALSLTTHAANGLTRNDFIVAAKIDAITK
jgi:4a-hydroxytetrahydrobiopterin dehydratase